MAELPDHGFSSVNLATRAAAVMGVSGTDFKQTDRHQYGEQLVRLKGLSVSIRRIRPSFACARFNQYFAPARPSYLHGQATISSAVWFLFMDRLSGWAGRTM